MGEKSRGGNLKKNKSNNFKNKFIKEAVNSYLNNSNSVILFLDENGNIKFLNKKGHEILGFNQGELTGKNWFETCLSNENIKDVKNNFYNIIHKKDNKFNFLENPIIQKDGSQRLFNWYNSVLKDDKGNSAGLLLLGNDITEQKNVKDMLKTSEDRFISFSDMLPGACFEVDIDQKILYANKLTHNLFGYKKEDIENGLSLSNLIAPEDKKNFFDDLNKILSGESIGWVEYKAVKKNGCYFPIKSNISSITDNGNIIGFRGILIDITESKMSEEIIRENEENYLTLFKSISDAVFVIDQKTNRFLDINDAAVKIYGYSRDEWLDMSISDISSDPSFTKKILDDLPLIIPICYHIKKDKTTFPVDITVNSFVFGNRRLIIAISRDITERINAEEKLITTNEYLQNVINSTPDIIITLDKNNKVSTWNKTAEYITGYKQKEIIGKNINKTNIFENFKRFDEIIENINHGSKIFSEEIIINTREGAKRIIKPSYSAITSPNKDSIGILFVGKDITYDREIHGKMIRGNSYLITDKKNNSAISLFENLIATGYEGLLITRGNPELIKSMLPLKDIKIILLNQNKLGGFENISDLNKLKDKINIFCKNHSSALILLDRVDYLITNFSFENFIKTLYQINSIITQSNSILLLNIDPLIFDDKQMAIIENELHILPDQKIEHIQINDHLYDILNFIYQQNQNNTIVSFTNIGNKFSIVRPTTAKRIMELEEKGLIYIKKQGRLKTLYISDKGKTLLNKRKIL